MPSDPRVELARRALAPALARFRLLLEASLEHGQALVASPNEARFDAATVLGPFAAGRIRADAFAAVFARTAELTPEQRTRLVDAVRDLRELCSREELPVVDVRHGASLPAVVEEQLTAAGRAFAAARVIASSRSGHASAINDMKPRPFDEWTKTERRSAPPLVLRVRGADLHGGGLERFLDGGQHVVLLVDGASSPAPLARLVTPGTLVLQTNDDFGVEQFARATGPAIAAIVPETAARFLHDPNAGGDAWQRMHVAYAPSPPFAPVPGFSSWQIREEVRQLESLAAVPAAADGAASLHTPEAVERLASWLLADLTSPEGQAR